MRVGKQLLRGHDLEDWITAGLCAESTALHHDDPHIVKFANDTTVVCLIWENYKLPNKKQVIHMVEWCRWKNLVLNVDKTKEIIVRKPQPPHAQINNAAVEISTSSWGFLLTAHCPGHPTSALW